MSGVGVFVRGAYDCVCDVLMFAHSMYMLVMCMYMYLYVGFVHVCVVCGCVWCVSVHVWSVCMWCTYACGVWCRCGVVYL